MNEEGILKIEWIISALVFLVIVGFDATQKIAQDRFCDSNIPFVLELLQYRG